MNASTNKKSSWAIVRNGAVSEFSITANDKPKQYFDNITNTLTVETNKAILQLKLDDSITPIIAENANYRCSPWSQNMYLCIPKKEAKLSSRKKLTHVKEWNIGTINGELWDLGIGYEDFNAYIIVNNVILHQYLKQKEGNHIINDSNLLNEIIKFSPYRFFMTKFASIIVKQKIPTHKDELDGPHTHLLPKIIINEVNFPIPISDDMSSQIQVDPFGAVIDGNGNYIDWDGFEHDEFQFILRKYGNKQNIETKFKIKNTICDFLENNDIQSIINMYLNPDLQNQIRIIIAQLVCDKTYNIEYRKKGLFILKNIRAINYPVLKQWIRRKSPELLN